MKETDSQAPTQIDKYIEERNKAWQEIGKQAVKQTRLADPEE